MTPEISARLQQIALLQQALEAAPSFMNYLRGRRAELVEKLVTTESEQTRGRIHEIDDLLALPERLQQEALSLTAAPQQMAELP